MPPFYKTLTQSGLYIIITSKSIYFWIGQNFYEDYLDESTYKKQQKLISDTLFNKIIIHYNAVHDEILEPSRSVAFFIEGQESKAFRKLLIEQETNHDSGEEDEEFQEAPFIDYESGFIRKSLIIP